jgi:hypothetical protein
MWTVCPELLARSPEEEHPAMENEGPRYFNDDGTEFNPGLHPTPDLCVSCVKNETQDAVEESVCNLTRADQQNEGVFLCFAYHPISSSINRGEVLRGLCEQAGMEYPEETAAATDDDSGPIVF